MSSNGLEYADSSRSAASKISDNLSRASASTYTSDGVQAHQQMRNSISDTAQAHLPGLELYEHTTGKNGEDLQTWKYKSADGTETSATADATTGKLISTEAQNADGSREAKHYDQGRLTSTWRADGHGTETTRKYDPTTNAEISSDQKYADGGRQHMDIDPKTHIVTSQTRLDKEGNGHEVDRDRVTGRINGEYQIVHGKRIQPGASHQTFFKTPTAFERGVNANPRAS